MSTWWGSFYLPGTQIIRNFFIYSFGAACLGGFSLLLTPLNAYLLTPTEFGTLALITSITNIGIILLGFGLRQFLALEYFHQDEAGRKKIINQIVVIYVSLALPFCIIFFVLPFFFKSQLLDLSISPDFLFLVLINIFFTFFAELFYQILRYQQSALLLTLIQVIIGLGTFLITFILLFFSNLGPLCTLMGQSFGICTATILALGHYRKEQFFAHRQKIPLSTFFELLKQSLPFVPSLILSWVIAGSDRLLLAYFAGTQEVATYAIADMFGAAFRLLVLQSWSGSYLPYILLQYQHNKDRLKNFEKQNLITMWTTLAVLSILIIGATLFANPILVSILPGHYHQATNYIFIILIAHLFLLGSYFAASYIQFQKRTTFLALSFCIPAIVNCILNLLLIPYFKIYGCSIATLISYATYFCIMLWYNYRIRSERI